MGTLKCVCSYLSCDIRPNQLEHTLLRVPIFGNTVNGCDKDHLAFKGTILGCRPKSSLSSNLTVQETVSYKPN